VVEEAGAGAMRAKIITVKRARRLRREMTLPEVLLWQALRRDQLGVGFRRQHSMGDYVLDFYCPSSRLAVEVDSEEHERGDRAIRDGRRDRWLESQGVRVMRIPAADILDRDGFDSVVRNISAAAASSTTGSSAGGPPSP
jgi:very-short-patch-repair endonuclease